MRTPEASPGERKLSSLLDLFASRRWIEREDIEVIECADMPLVYRNLLDHHYHMTVTLEAHHGSEVKLVILERKEDGDTYSRRLLLTAGAEARVVLAGVMRIRLEHCQEEVRRRIIEGRTPLGRILIEHDVLRWIEPEAYLQVRVDGALARLFGCPRGERTTYGRVATIFCDHEPAVELLEIVAPEEAP